MTTCAIWAAITNTLGCPFFLQELKPALGAGFGLNGGAVLLARLGLGAQLHPMLSPFEKLEVIGVRGDRELCQLDVLKVRRAA